jgi:hypothetical protein
VKTFVVRLWAAVDPADEAHEPLHGVVEHVGSGRSAPFASEDELLAFLRDAAAQGSAEPLTRPGSADGGFAK